jgi:integrase
MAIVRRGYNLAMQEDPPVIRRAPKFPMMPEDNIRQGFIEHDQYERLLEELPTHLKAIFVSGYHVGCRKNELRNIRWPQIDWDARLIRLTMKQTKNKTARSAPIYGDMERWLRFQQQNCPEGCEWVFYSGSQHKSHRGRRISEEFQGWQEACERAGVPELIFHDLRRSAVRNMVNARVPLKTIMEIIGHKTMKMLERYNIIDEANFREVGRTMQQYFEQKRRERSGLELVAKRS